MTAVKMVIRRLSFDATRRPPGEMTSQGWPNWA
jgi:hypothetical protein